MKKHLDIIVVDIETTGLDDYDDEIIQLSVLNENENVLFNKYLRPTRKTEWSEAEVVNHITYDMVKDKTDIGQELENVQEIISAADNIVSCNAGFVVGFLRRAGVTFSSSQRAIDIMETFAEIYGEFDDNFLDYRYRTLSECAAHYGYEWDGKPHNSLADAKAVLHCFKQIKKGDEIEPKSYPLI